MENIHALFQFIATQIRGYGKENKKQRKFKAYYMETKADSRTNMAKVIDYVLWRFAFFFIAFFIAFQIHTNLLIAVIIAAVTLSLLHAGSTRIRNKKLQQLTKEKRRFIASQRVYQEMMNKTGVEIKSYIIKILEKSGFTDLEMINSDHRLILLKSVYNKEEVMISLNVYKGEYYVELKEMKEFVRFLIDHKVKTGIMITTSDFTSDCYELMEQLNDRYKMLIFNKEKLLKLIESNDMFPDEKEIDEMISNKISQRERKWEKYKSTALSQKKIKGYILLGIYLIIGAFYTPYKVYYMAVAGMVIGLGCIAIVVNILNKKNLREEGAQGLSELLRDK
ncbi:hypothetical protein Amet_2900 [Alkaliphilus metalliredigens QYMF]|uniref:Restriction endonuclease type IV Mrr domain-containing protein n=1 Tax=Alkaliphilus metalliredigens (strain QYMF) TaxID=293826 RepID=A6TS82_ALKMQ|nr:restriction endonuclease [Alkaliphilus metalliredigens]ABR49050.1 hypothetical protein Amet_2900 [Alkaliphilus metalliredigens QYMF]